MNATQRGSLQKKFSRGPVVWTVAKTARNNGDELSAIFEKREGERDEGRVKIDGLDSGAPEGQTMLRIASYLLVRWIQDRVRVSGEGFDEEIPGESLRRGENEIPSAHGVLGVQVRAGLRKPPRQAWVQRAINFEGLDLHALERQMSRGASF